MLEEWGYQERPCNFCYTVENTDKCNNKECRRWAAWFLLSWEKTKELLQPYLKEDETDGN
jgi:hypothetical protein